MDNGSTDGSDDPQLLLKLLDCGSALPGAMGCRSRPEGRSHISLDADLAVTARTLGLAKANLSPQQRFGNWLACFLIRALWGYRYRDLGPLRVIRREALDKLQMRDTTWGWNVEMQIKAITHGLRIRQVDVPYGHRMAGKSKISGTISGTIRAGWKILTTIARERVAHHHGPVSGARPRENAAGARHR